MQVLFADSAGATWAPNHGKKVFVLHLRWCYGCACNRVDMVEPSVSYVCACWAEWFKQLAVVQVRHFSWI